MFTHKFLFNKEKLFSNENQNLVSAKRQLSHFLSTSMTPAVSSPKWLRNCATVLNSIICFVVFLIFDLLDVVFCVIYRFLDKLIEGEASSCCCSNWKKQNKKKMMMDVREYEDDDGVSDSLYLRKSIFREMGFLQFGKKRESFNRKCCESSMTRWSDCRCESCISWLNNDGDYKLHFVVRKPLMAKNPSENVIFLHGFLSSSSFWTETVFPQFSAEVNNKYQLIAFDLLGFGKSPKPRDSLYTLKDHVDMIAKSVIQPLELGTFHLVAHSMGCIIALALAAKYPNSVKSITLVAPPYSSSEGSDASLNALAKLAGKKLWPPLSFGSSFMSWYEHLGRTVCLVYCRNHRIWETILKFITRKRDLHFLVTDFTKHTHQSAWNSMHNVICGGAKFMDSYLAILSKSGVRINVIQGDKDQIVRMECCSKLKLKAPKAEINIILNADHRTVVFGREKELAHSLEHTWKSCC